MQNLMYRRPTRYNDLAYYRQEANNVSNEISDAIDEAREELTTCCKSPFAIPHGSVPACLIAAAFWAALANLSYRPDLDPGFRISLALGVGGTTGLASLIGFIRANRELKNTTSVNLDEIEDGITVLLNHLQSDDCSLNDADDILGTLTSVKNFLTGRVTPGFNCVNVFNVFFAGYTGGITSFVVLSILEYLERGDLRFVTAVLGGICAIVLAGWMAIRGQQDELLLKSIQKAAGSANTIINAKIGHVGATAVDVAGMNTAQQMLIEDNRQGDNYGSAQTPIRQPHHGLTEIVEGQPHQVVSRRLSH